MTQDPLKMLNGNGATVLLPLQSLQLRSRPVSGDGLTPKILDAWATFENLWVRAARRIPPSVDIERRRVGWQRTHLLSRADARRLGNVNTYRWREGKRWAAVASLIIVDDNIISVTLVGDDRLLALQGGEYSRARLEVLLPWMKERLGGPESPGPESSR